MKKRNFESGMLKENQNLLTLPDIDLTTINNTIISGPMQSTYTRGTTYFELSNHLGNPDSGSGQVVLEACAEQAQPCRSMVTDRKKALMQSGSGGRPL